MAKEETNQEVVEDRQETTDDRFTLKHVGFGRYDVDGQRFESKDKALAYVQSKQAEEEDEAEYGAVLPDGYDMSITERPFVYRNSLMELAMNERFAPDGSFNKYFDRKWVWGWAAQNGTDISDKQAKGYVLVTLPQLQEGVDKDEIPSHILTMVREEGSYLVYGDSVLMRMPRVLWRQRQAQKFESVMRRMKNLDRKQKDAFREHGVDVKEGGTGDNELSIRF